MHHPSCTLLHFPLVWCTASTLGTSLPYGHEGVSWHKSDTVEWCEACMATVSYIASHSIKFVWQGSSFGVMRVRCCLKHERLGKQEHTWRTMLQARRVQQRLAIRTACVCAQRNAVQDYVSVSTSCWAEKRCLNCLGGIRSSLLSEAYGLAGYSTAMVSTKKKLPPVSSIETATLTAKDGTTIQAKVLWENSPVFIYCIRRPGWCVCICS